MNYTTRKYNHLSLFERFFIEKSIENHASLRSIARELKRNVSTISREIAKNSDFDNGYESSKADKKSKTRCFHKYMFKFSTNFSFEKFTKIFKSKYDKKFFGVKATHNYIKENFEVNSPSLRTIFNWIKTNRWIIKRNDRLRQYYKKGGKRQASVISRLVTSADYVFPIWTRPKNIDLRLDYGHWEADLVLGKRATGYRNILTLTERKTRIGFAAFVTSKSPFEINAKLKTLIKSNNLNVKSITIDNGIEFERIGILAKWLNIYIYRAEPYASFQRGSNENWNGMLRREFKKGFNFNLINQETLDFVIEKINKMPREILLWKSSYELFMYENFGEIID
ncbi:IS30 family transposase [Metamycoplasma hyosynoviae]|uniref:IS30 family transposase n=1 Tax=Metamycoplasma hyosynoviae TaxID=29559 RepID=UPI0023589585|nr:IS30 family transposase [Metamycoplasma hyosynoviae]MDC8921801.1 IS30 family transposase [Metamycoplasma hyosynoviae]